LENKERGEEKEKAPNDQQELLRVKNIKNLKMESLNVPMVIIFQQFAAVI
jgi:hypothetical protein